MGEWLESIAESRGGSGEWESGGNGKLIFSGAGRVVQPVYSHIPRQKGSLGHTRLEGEPLSVIVFVLLAI